MSLGVFNGVQPFGLLPNASNSKDKNRICLLCKTDIENEFHFVMECTQLHNLRQHLFESLTKIVPAFANMNTDDKFRFIMISYDYDINKICMKKD